MAKQAVWWLTPLLMVAAALVGCDEGDDDDDNDDQTDDATAAITAIVEEMTEGYMARTPEALEQKVFVHLSDDYDYAGFNKDEYMADALDDLAENDTLHIDDYELAVDVDVSEDGRQAVAHTENRFQATLPAKGDVEFDVRYEATNRGATHFVLEDDGEWRVVAGEAAYGEWLGSGGADALATDLSDVTVSAQEVGPGDTVQVSGMIPVPGLSGAQQARLVLALDWQDERNNADRWYYPNESVYEVDLTDSAGQEYELNVNLPVQGRPSGLPVPETLPRGVDNVDVMVHVTIYENTTFIRYDNRNFGLPFQPLANADPCQAGPTGGIDGVWTTAVEFADLELPLFFQLFDLARVGDDLYGSIAYAGKDDGDNWWPIVFDVTGEVNGAIATFGFSDEGMTVEYTAEVVGTELQNGVLVIDDGSGSLPPLDFTSTKLDNRCVGVTADDLDGHTLSVAVGAGALDFTVTMNVYAVTLNSLGLTMNGFVFRNVLAAVDLAQTQHWLALAFYDDAGGWAASVDATEPTAGTVSIVD